MEITFRATEGDRFFLYGLTQAFRLNDGALDASNNVATELLVDGQTEAESVAAFSASLVIAPASEINSPSVIALFSLVLFGLVYRRKQT